MSFPTHCVAVAAAAILMTGCATMPKTDSPAAAPAPDPGTQASRSMSRVVPRTYDLRYLVYVPPGYDGGDTESWPLMLFLHGAGERGTDLDKVKIHGPPRLVEEGREFPFVLVSPQWADEETWWSTDHLDALLLEIGENYRIDPDRIYVTGLSMGGFGTWNLAIRYPDRFAAIAPVCGGADPDRAERIRHLPIRVYHGAKDEVVPPERSRDMVAALRELDADVEYTEYPDATHDSWSATYANPELYEWFLGHRRTAP